MNIIQIISIGLFIFKKMVRGEKIVGHLTIDIYEKYDDYDEYIERILDKIFANFRNIEELFIDLINLQR